ncbi:MAG TPA: hypothetical protein VFT43_08825 [Candidatus Polarisedimenticolia bacterium]|nr:hypothetical protein [Candidatus Polarisedimenticolia bacterium]
MKRLHRTLTATISCGLVVICAAAIVPGAPMIGEAIAADAGTTNPLATNSPADGRDLSLASIVAAAADRPAGFGGAPRDPSAILAAVAGTDSFPVTCATPLVTLLVRPDAPLPPSLRESQAALAARPSLDNERVALTHDGFFAIHYSGSSRGLSMLGADRDHNGLPETVDHLAEALAAARSFLVSGFGYPAPAPDGERLDVLLVDLDHGLEGYTAPGRDPSIDAAPASGLPTAAAGASQRFIVLDTDLPAERLMTAVLHQVAHASLLALAPRAPHWWAEATAAFLTVEGSGDLAGHAAALRARLASPDRGLGSDSLLLMEGSLLWPLFLAERSGDPGVVRQIWSEMAAQGNDPAAATDLVLKRGAGLTLADAYREYAAWNLFTGPRDDGRHYSFSRALPEAALPTVGPALPVVLDPVEPVEPLGSVPFRLPGEGGRGTLDLDITAEGGRPGVDLLVAYRSEAPRQVLVPIALNEAGSGRVSIPWADALEAWIILRNDAAAPGAAARFSLRAARDPYAPFDLASFTAQPLGASIALEWTTASEKGLLGWNVYRAESPTGPFARLNDVAVPAYGDGTADTGYIFQDDTARPGRRYYYLVEGLTSLGLTERSYLVSARILPAR